VFLGLQILYGHTILLHTSLSKGHETRKPLMMLLMKLLHKNQPTKDGLLQTLA
jgi:hypothetical protein